MSHLLDRLELNAFFECHILQRADTDAEAPRRPKVGRIPYLGLGERTKWVLEGSCDTLPVPFLRKIVWKTCRLDQSPTNITYADIALLLSQAETIATQEAYSKSGGGAG